MKKMIITGVISLFLILHFYIKQCKKHKFNYNLQHKIINLNKDAWFNEFKKADIID